MQSVTSLFNTLWRGSHRAVVKAVINDSITIGEDKITNLKTDGALFAENDFSFGGCISRQFEMSFYPGNITIPRMAKVQLYMQLTNGTQTSEWISKGIFYIDTRETDSNGLMKITGYDAMLKTEQDFIPTSTPQSMQATASQIATAIGVSLDSRCVFQNYDCQLVTGYSMREILGFIAGVHGGNWIITDTGNLRLVRTSSSVDSFTITNRELMSYNRGSTYASVTKVIINIDDETYVEAGNTTGRTVEVTCPWATTDMAQALLAQLGSVSYTPCTASVLLHPAAEIGDKFVVSSISHSIATQTIHFNSLFLSELEVPGEEEIDHEYPFESASERTANRKIAAVVAETAELRVTTQQISARVGDVEGDVATISLTATSLTSRITSVEGDITTLEQTTTSISATVSGKADKTAGEVSSFSYSLTATGFTLYSKGNQVMSVTSSGANIAGWIITGSKLYHPHDTGNDGVGIIHAGGPLIPSLWQKNENSRVVFYSGAKDNNPHPEIDFDCYFGVLADGSVYCQALKATSATITGNITATSGTIGNQTHAFTIGSTGTSANIYCGTSSMSSSGQMGVSSNQVYIGTDGMSYKANVSDSAFDYTTVIRSGLVMAYGDISGTGDYNRATIMLSNGVIFCNAGTNKVGDVYIRDYEVAMIELQRGANYAYLSGTWKSASSISITSDRNQKHNIENLDDRYSLIMDKLKPRRFKYDDGQSDRYHTGFIAQEVKDSMDEVGLDTKDLAAYVAATIDGDQTVLSLRYEEFISLNTWAIQKLKARVAHLEELLTAQGVQI